jgi:hypothetical protein
MNRSPNVSHLLHTIANFRCQVTVAGQLGLFQTSTVSRPVSVNVYSWLLAHIQTCDAEDQNADNFHSAASISRRFICLVN